MSWMCSSTHLNLIRHFQWCRPYLSFILNHFSSKNVRSGSPRYFLFSKTGQRSPMFQVIVELEGEQLGRVRGEVRDRHVKTGKENRRQTVKRVQSNFVSVLVMPGSSLAGLKVDYMIQLTRRATGGARGRAVWCREGAWIVVDCKVWSSVWGQREEATTGKQENCSWQHRGKGKGYFFILVQKWAWLWPWPPTPPWCPPSLWPCLLCFLRSLLPLWWWRR